MIGLQNYCAARWQFCSHNYDSCLFLLRPCGSNVEELPRLSSPSKPPGKGHPKFSVHVCIYCGRIYIYLHESFHWTWSTLWSKSDSESPLDCPPPHRRGLGCAVSGPRGWAPALCALLACAVTDREPRSIQQINGCLVAFLLPVTGSRLINSCASLESSRQFQNLLHSGQTECEFRLGGGGKGGWGGGSSQLHSDGVFVHSYACALQFCSFMVQTRDLYMPWGISCFRGSLALMHWSVALSCYPFCNLSEHLPTGVT